MLSSRRSLLVRLLCSFLRRLFYPSEKSAHHGIPSQQEWGVLFP